MLLRICKKDVCFSLSLTVVFAKPEQEKHSLIVMASWYENNKVTDGLVKVNLLFWQCSIKMYSSANKLFSKQRWFKQEALNVSPVVLE